MENLVVVNTGNRHGQILIFDAYEKAESWLRRATTLNDEQIRDEIHLVTSIGCPDGCVQTFGIYN